MALHVAVFVICPFSSILFFFQYPRWCDRTCVSAVRLTFCISDRLWTATQWKPSFMFVYMRQRWARRHLQVLVKCLTASSGCRASKGWNSIHLPNEQLSIAEERDLQHNWLPLNGGNSRKLCYYVFYWSTLCCVYWAECSKGSVDGFYFCALCYISGVKCRMMIHLLWDRRVFCHQDPH